MLASLLYPYDSDAPAAIDLWITQCEAEGCLRRYKIKGDTYIDIPNWLKHQKIDRPSPSKLPSFDEASRVIVEPSIIPIVGREGKGKERTKERIREDSRKIADESYKPNGATREWAEKRGFALMWDQHLEYFQNYLAQLKNRRKYTDLDAAFRNCLSSDWGNLRKNAGARVVHGNLGTTPPKAPCGHCKQPITGGYTRMDILGNVCNKCWSEYQEGRWK